VLNCSWVANPWVNGTPTAILVNRLALVKRECQFLAQDHLVDWPNAPIFTSMFQSARVRLIILGATVCFSRIELTSHGSPARGLAADVVILPLHTRH
jgi:hypothetical protein